MTLKALQGKNGPIEEDKPASEVRQEPFSLVKGFEWSDVDLEDEGQQQELYQLLNENYVEDDDNMFRWGTWQWDYVSGVPGSNWVSC